MYYSLYIIDILGALNVTTGSAVTGKMGKNVTILCTVTGPETSQIIWKKEGADITIDGIKYTGSTPSSPSITIYNLVKQDAGQYQCTATNPGGTYPSLTTATLTVISKAYLPLIYSIYPSSYLVIHLLKYIILYISVG
jgi:hypothetical protein